MDLGVRVHWWVSVNNSKMSIYYNSQAGMQQQVTLDSIVRVAEASGMQQIDQSRVRIMSQHNLIHDLNDILRAYVKDDIEMD